ncbi:DUF1015 family protein [Mucilaginibacter sp. RS28]|uniref:DUF1015 family protein n=1 Tax=Mucilaginibacter straminoryzae TaxID=2932774 RepID=A0A9X1WZX3_9SPHI|nr:DUF1015 family protein [Mucilaginibacter straminoryzae]MCJ8208226.1 DUF1015 family protein [Mucilaginibacter straminoryzae]
MATIKAFKAIRPQLKEVEALIGAESLHQPQYAFHKTAETDSDVAGHQDLHTLLKSRSLFEAEQNALYLYETDIDGQSITGVIALTCCSDLQQSRIKKHEYTLKEKESAAYQARCRAATEDRPVLLAYQPDEAIHQLICGIKAASVLPLIYTEGEKLHQLWEVTDEVLIEELQDAFKKLGTVYLAEGHHRMAAVEMAMQAKKAQEISSKENLADCFLSMYVCAGELKSQKCYCLFRPDKTIDRDQLITIIRKSFKIIPSANNKPVVPSQKHHFGMCLGGDWYELIANEEIIFSPNLIDRVDPNLLHKFVLRPALGLNDTNANHQLIIVGGANAMERLATLLEQEPSAIGFTLHPVSVNQLISVAYTDNLMPPDSTWAEPRLPFGLLMYKF